MKKILALALAAMMLMVVTGAMAATGSKEDLKSTIVFIGEGIIEVVWVEEIPGEDAPIEEIEENIIQVHKNGGSPLDKLPKEIRTQLPASYKVVNELEKARLEGDVNATDEFKAAFKFSTPYEPGSVVYVAICVADENSEEWVLLQGEADEDGNIVLTFDKELLQKVGNETFLMMVISEK